MGKLKTALTNLATLADGIEKKGDKSLGEMTARATSVSQIGGRVAAGYELLYMYLKQKALTEKTKIEAWQKDPLQAHLDSKVSGFIAQIEQARSELIAVFKNYDDVANLLVQTLTADIDRAAVYGKEVEAMIAKRKKKLLQSAKYKAKIANYEKNLTELSGKLKTLKVDVSSLRQQTQALGPNKIASLQIKTSTTIAQVLNVASIGLSRQLDEIKNSSSNKRVAVLLKGFGNELKMIRGWVAEADSMEAESEEK